MLSFPPMKHFGYVTHDAEHILRYFDAVTSEHLLHTKRKPFNRSYESHYYQLQNGWECTVLVVPRDDPDFDYEMMMHARLFDDIVIEPQTQLPPDGVLEILHCRKIKPEEL